MTSFRSMKESQLEAKSFAGEIKEGTSSRSVIEKDNASGGDAGKQCKRALRPFVRRVPGFWARAAQGNGTTAGGLAGGYPGFV